MYKEGICQIYIPVLIILVERYTKNNNNDNRQKLSSLNILRSLKDMFFFGWQNL